MAPLQTKMAAQLGSFMDALVDPTTHLLPDLHVAVISSSFGGGAWSNVNQCGAGAHPGDDRGFFQQGPGGAGMGSCSMLNQGATYLANGDGNTPPNFSGDIRDAFKCIALLGDTGCGFESQFESTYYALYYANQAYSDTQTDTSNPFNGGFLRSDAVLAIVMLTNEDDCSVNGDSLLLNPAVNSVMDDTGLGALWSYRCNEFGHLCDGQPPPHNPPPAGGVVLNNCVSAENEGKTDDKVTDPKGNPDKTQGHLWPTVKDFSDYVRSFKTNADDILVAAIAGPVTPYKVIPQVNNAAMGETDPAIDHSCTQPGSGDPEYADPAVRIKQWVDTFGSNGVFYPICADTLNKAMVGIADKIHQKLGASCIASKIAWLDETDHSKGHNCQVSQKVTDKNGMSKTTDLPECDGGNTNAPCFSLTFDSPQCTASTTAKTLFKVCNEATCMAMMSTSSDEKNATIACAVDE
jgi:hypothetical protein